MTAPAVRRAPRAALAAAAAAVLATAPAPAATAPGMGLGAAEEPGGAGGRVHAHLLGGILHFHTGQWYYVATAELGGELRLSPRLALAVVAPLATVERDGDIMSGWGNLGAALHHRSVAVDGDTRWLRQLTLYLSAPTAVDTGEPGFAAQAAADVHTALDYGDYLPSTSTARLHGTLRWEREPWAAIASAGYRFHFFTYAQGETEFLHVLVASLGAEYGRGARAGRRAVALAIDTWSDMLEDRWADGDRFRHVARVEGALAVAGWRATVRLLVPLDFVLRDDPSPMIGLSLERGLRR
jgi:hypothetical protein